MELRHIRLLVTTAETLNFRQAAERMGVSPPAVSQQVRAIETELGLTLFARRARGVALTEAGALLMPTLRAIAEQAARLGQEAESLKRGERGVVVLGYSTSLMSEDRLPERLRAFCEANPGAEIDFRPLRVADAVEQLAGGALDVAVMRMPLPPVPDTLRAQPFTRSPMRLAVPADHRLAAAEALPVAALNGATLVIMGDAPGVGLGHVVQALLARNGIRPAQMRRIEDMSTVMGMVAAGMGVAVVPEGIARSHARVRAIPFSDISPACEAAVLSRAQNAPPLMRKLVQTLIR